MTTTMTSILYMILSLTTLSGAAVAAWFSWKALKCSGDREGQNRLLTLAGGIGFVVFSFRMIAVPIWIIALNSLVSFTPGAMCPLGVHRAIGTLAWLASAAKIGLPGIYAAWLVRNYLDSRIPERPFIITNAMFLIAAGVFAFIESTLDLLTLASLKPVKVSCCGSFFNTPGGGAPDITHTAGLPWFIAFVFIAAILSIIGTRIFPEKRLISWLKMLLAPSAMITLGFTLHSYIAPYHLVKMKPDFRCIFCLLTEFPLISASALAASIGIWILSVPFNDMNQEERLKGNLKRTRILGLAMTLIGTLYLIISTWLKM